MVAFCLEIRFVGEPAFQSGSRRPPFELAWQSVAKGSGQAAEAGCLKSSNVEKAATLFVS